jgi:hypothetical protein
MRRRGLRLDLETLEGKALLSGATTGLAASVVATPTTSATGTTVDLSFTETNVSDHDIQVTFGPIDDGFDVARNGTTAWVSNSGIEPQFLELKTLEPGQSLTVSSTWNGQANSPGSTSGPALSGTFTITNQLDPSASTTVTLGSTSTGSSPVSTAPTGSTPVVKPSGGHHHTGHGHIAGHHANGATPQPISTPVKT